MLARRAADDTPFSANEIHAVAPHEVGNLLGLPHVTDRGQIMAPRIRARTLSPEDEASIRKLYRLFSSGAAAETAEDPTPRCTARLEP